MAVLAMSVPRTRDMTDAKEDATGKHQARPRPGSIGILSESTVLEAKLSSE